MRLRRTACILLAVLLTFSMIVSCSYNGDEDPNILVPVSLCTKNKALSVSSDLENMNLVFKYTAIPNYTGYIKGTVSTFTDISFSGGTANLGLFSQGSWTFTLKALNESGSVVYQGSSTVFLKSGGMNTVVIDLERKEETGNGILEIDFTGPKLGVSDYALILRYRKAGETEYRENKTAWDAVEDKGVIRYTGNMSLSAGSYELNFVYLQSGKQMGGDTVSAQIFKDEKTFVTGSIDSGVAVTGQIQINYNGSGNSFYGEKDTYPGRKTVFYWKGETSSASFSWSVNGTALDCHTSSCSFCEMMPGEYTLVCSATVDTAVKTGTYKITVLPPEKIEFFELRAGSLGTNELCIGYRDESGTMVSFPYSYCGEKVENATGASYGLTPVLIVPTTTSDIDYLENVEFGTFPQYASGMSVANSKTGKKLNYTLVNAVVDKDTVTGALASCKSLKTVVFRKGVSAIPIGGCEGCDSLETVYISSTVSSIKTRAFANCPNLKTVYIEEGNSSFDTLKGKFDAGVEVKVSSNHDLFR